MIISFLVSLRIISNPTKHGLLKFKSIDLFYVTPEAKKAAYNTIKERMLSFYFALIEVTLFYFFMRYVFYLWNESPKTFESFIALISPNTSIPAFISFLIAYLIALFISAGISEGILRIWEPIDSNLKYYFPALANPIIVIHRLPVRSRGIFAICARGFWCVLVTFIKQLHQIYSFQ